MAMPMRTLAKRTQQAKDTAKEVTHYVRQQMTKGEVLRSKHPRIYPNLEHTNYQTWITIWEGSC